ncbi:MAG: hypothetical protein IPH84_14500, partial [Bacteroidales bacterium]|nr:hypothetical protein [Bacteroidales bacterium]
KGNYWDKYSGYDLNRDKKAISLQAGKPYSQIIGNFLQLFSFSGVLWRNCSTKRKKPYRLCRM